METRPYVPWELMGNFMIDVFKAYGVPEEDARICADVLLESDRRGIESHGCNRFKPIYIDRIVKGTLLPVTNLEVVKETPTTVVMDAHDGLVELLAERRQDAGLVGGAHVLEAALGRARRGPAGAVTAVVADVEGLVAARSRGLGGGDVFVGMVDAGGALGILPDGFFVVGLCGEGGAAKQRGGRCGESENVHIGQDLSFTKIKTIFVVW